jgi:ubiquinone biosynthesis UbiH/UbiF/VisC/COQ6 family hydroxylase
MSADPVLVVGGGMVGLAFACAAQDMPVTVFESQSPDASAPGEDWDSRIFALSPGTRRFLIEIGAWDKLDGARVTAVGRMEVAGDAGGALEFDAPPGEALAWIVEGTRLAHALRARAREIAGVSLFAPVAGQALATGASGCELRLEDGTLHRGSLAVGADGSGSWVRDQLGVAVDCDDYGKTALVANFAVERAHGGIARQWFAADGILAWLPLAGNRMSIVWSAGTGLAAELAALDAAGFARRVAAAGGEALGELRLESPVQQFALRRLRARALAVPGAVLVGDAAHTLHPLAGQGVNLGFRDAQFLAETLRARSPLERAGDTAVLRRYERARREDIAAMSATTHALDRLFALDSPVARRLRNAGLSLTNRLKPLKRALALHAMQ